VGDGRLVLSVYALVGVLAAVALRTTGPAIGLGLLYVLLFEQDLLILPLSERAGEVLAQATIGTNAFALATFFSGQPTRPAMTVPHPAKPSPCCCSTCSFSPRPDSRRDPSDTARPLPPPCSGRPILSGP
jgi:hypothetical protein